MTVHFQQGGQAGGLCVEAEPGQTLLAVAQVAGVDLVAVCGGAGICGDCRVRVLAGAVSPPAALEDDHLSQAEQDAGVRLACQTTLLGDSAVIDVPPESMRAGQRVLTEGAVTGANGAGHTPAERLVAVHDLYAEPATTDDLRGDWERLHGLPPDCPLPDPAVLAGLPHLLRGHGWHVRLLTHDGRPAAFVAPGVRPLGLAVDLGTTTLAAYLVDLLDGTVLGVTGRENPQMRYGADVMARLTAVMRSPELAGELSGAVVAVIDELARSLCEAAAVPVPAVVDCVIAGNTAMHHLLLRLPVESLSTAPYVPVTGSALDTAASAAGLHLAAGGRLSLPPLVAGFVGADHVAMLLAAGIDQPGPVTLALDIGTNTEISLRVREQILTCSAASGPAFEGAHIRDGMRAGAGAIERVAWEDGGLRWLVIGDAAPVGLCGSGLIDLLGVLRERDLLTPLGAFAPGTPGLDPAAQVPGIVVVPAAQTAHGRPIRLDRRDISELQVAKGAIRVGIKLLVEAAGITESDIAQVVVAGAFGSYIDIRHAVGIGLLPDLPRHAFTQIGNAAGTGAQMLLLDRRVRRRAEALVHRATYLELTTHPDFADRFSQAVLLTPDPWE